MTMSVRTPRRSRRLLALILFGMAGSLSLNAQVNTALEGRVTGQGGRALGGAHVQVLGATTISALSDVEGYLRVQGLSAGSVDVRISLIGFQDQLRTVVLQSGSVTGMDVTLEVSPLALEGILVEGQVGQAEAFNRQRTATSIRSVVSSEQIERFPDATVPDALRRIPGISARPDRGETGYIFSSPTGLPEWMGTSSRTARAS